MTKEHNLHLTVISSVPVVGSSQPATRTVILIIPIIEIPFRERERDKQSERKSSIFVTVNGKLPRQVDR